jgi:hypothetical protein
MSTLRIRFAGLAIVAAALVLGGCAAPADKQAMTVSKTVVVAKKHPYAVGVAVRGGSETTTTTSSNIADADLKAAIEGSIRETQVFREVVQGRNGQYELAVNVVQLSKPSFGFSFTVDMEAGWTVTRVSDNQVVFRKAINSTYTASASDAFVGATRLRLAVEGAAKANIAQGLAAIGAVDL